MLLAKTGGSSSSILIIYVVVFGALWFFYLRPRSKKQKAQRLESRKVDVGDRAQTIGGFVGTVVKQDSDLVTLRSASGVELDFVPSAIARRFDPVVPESQDDEPESEEGDNK
ncbi:MAG TPA: preprotein translocase subunit YajC [Acidimicrobiales bacterium]|nr:preprotein translocase subunit YajC [Acidimicrobiales bacterium]